MSKVVSGRVDEKLNQKIVEDGRTHTQIIKDALHHYYSNVDGLYTPPRR